MANTQIPLSRNEMPTETPRPEVTAPPKIEPFIVTCTNDNYHERILNLFKIPNNEKLNMLYYKKVPHIHRESLLMADLSTSLNDARVKTFTDALLPDSLFNNRISF